MVRPSLFELSFEKIGLERTHLLVEQTCSSSGGRSSRVDEVGSLSSFPVFSAGVEEAQLNYESLITTNRYYQKVSVGGSFVPVSYPFVDAMFFDV